MTGERRERQTGRALIPLAVSWSIAIVFLVGISLQTAVPIEQLFLDATAVNGQKWYAGSVTSLGILMWTVAVCGCLATAYVAHLGQRAKAANAFRGAAVVFGVLLLDDLFLLHSNLLPSITGLPKLAFLGMEMVLAAIWLVSAVPQLGRTRWELLVAASVGFAVSLFTDAFFDGRGAAWLMAEDGSKFLGIVALATWSGMTATDVVRSVVRPEPEGGTVAVTQSHNESDLADSHR